MWRGGQRALAAAAAVSVHGAPRRPISRSHPPLFTCTLRAARDGAGRALVFVGVSVGFMRGREGRRGVKTLASAKKKFAAAIGGGEWGGGRPRHLPLHFGLSPQYFPQDAVWQVGQGHGRGGGRGGRDWRGVGRGGQHFGGKKRERKEKREGGGGAGRRPGARHSRKTVRPPPLSPAPPPLPPPPHPPPLPPPPRPGRVHRHSPRPLHARAGRGGWWHGACLGRARGGKPPRGRARHTHSVRPTHLSPLSLSLSTHSPPPALPTPTTHPHPSQP